MSTSNTCNLSKEPYYHYIPRCVLRRFQFVDDTHVQYRNSKERNRARQRARKEGSQTENILCYDITSTNLDVQPIAMTYGVHDLYQEINDPGEVEDVEQKLANLEDEAAAVIKIVHEKTGPRTITFKRTQVESLRKFLFITCYRSAAKSKNRFQPRQPKNALVPWFRDLRYFLDSPYSQIMRDGDSALTNLKQSDGLKSLKGFSQTSGGLNLNISENDIALAFKGESDHFFLCMWEAADGEEFVLGNNSFGLCEGLIRGEAGSHWMFPVSPRLVFALRDVRLRPELRCTFANIGLQSHLEDITQAPPTPVTSRKANMRNSEDTSLTGKWDQLRFKVMKLTIAQTFQINRVFLENVRSNGSLTFVSKRKALAVLREYLRCPTTWFLDLYQTKPKYVELAAILRTDIAQKPFIQAVLSDKAVTTNFDRGETEKPDISSGLDASQWGTSVDPFEETVKKVNTSDDAYDECHQDSSTEVLSSDKNKENPLREQPLEVTETEPMDSFVLPCSIEDGDSPLGPSTVEEELVEEDHRCSRESRHFSLSRSTKIKASLLLVSFCSLFYFSGFPFSLTRQLLRRGAL